VAEEGKMKSVKRILQVLEEAKRLAFDLENETLIYFLDMSLSEILENMPHPDLKRGKPEVRLISSGANAYNT
jgi:hypothetical protein